MNVLLKLFIAFVIGAVATFVAGLILAHFWAVLVGIVVGVVYFFSGPDFPERR